MRLIDADELLVGTLDHDQISTHLVYNAPTIDAVKVVRCKDCRWAYPRKLKGETGVHCVFHRIDKDNNGYCDTGEERE
jgi:hypothetical protein